uniref:Uncharacterized protein n=1 Tax=Salix viminalis TaxID=40686 RepID=A0A6N2M6X6_SALVM
MTQNVELPDMTLHIDLEENNTSFQGCSICEGNKKVANCVVTPSKANGDSKEALQDVGPVSKSSLPSMNSEADGMEVMEIYLIMLKLRIDLFTMEEMKSYLTMLKSRIDLTQQLVRMP